MRNKVFISIALMSALLMTACGGNSTVTSMPSSEAKVPAVESRAERKEASIAVDESLAEEMSDLAEVQEEILARAEKEGMMTDEGFEKWVSNWVTVCTNQGRACDIDELYDSLVSHRYLTRPEDKFVHEVLSKAQAGGEKFHVDSDEVKAEIIRQFNEGQTDAFVVYQNMHENDFFKPTEEEFKAAVINAAKSAGEKYNLDSETVFAAIRERYAEGDYNAADMYWRLKDGGAFVPSQDTIAAGVLNLAKANNMATKGDVETAIREQYDVGNYDVDEIFQTLCDKGIFKSIPKDTEIVLCRISGNWYKITGVNPKTGEEHVINEFMVFQSHSNSSDNVSWYTYPEYTLEYSNRIPLRRMFSEDYTYIAYTHWSEETSQYHAGGYMNPRDDSGEIDFDHCRIADLTEHYGFVGGDFDAPVKQMAIGFYENNLIFADVKAGWHNQSEWTFYKSAVSGSSFSSPKEYKDFNLDDYGMEGDNWEWLGDYWEVTDWIDDQRCLINYPAKQVGLAFGGDRIDRWDSRIYDKNSGKVTSYIPGESRSNWSGVVSPDGSQIAFLSAPVSGTGSASLYVTGIDGGDPVKLVDGLASGRDDNSSRMCTRPGQGANSLCVLLEWRGI